MGRSAPPRPDPPGPRVGARVRTGPTVPHRTSATECELELGVQPRPILAGSSVLHTSYIGPSKTGSAPREEPILPEQSNHDWRAPFRSRTKGGQTRKAHTQPSSHPVLTDERERERESSDRPAHASRSPSVRPAGHRTHTRWCCCTRKPPGRACERSAYERSMCSPMWRGVLLVADEALLDARRGRRLLVGPVVQAHHEGRPADGTDVV